MAARADVVLVARGFAESRARARAAIEAGGVRVNGVVLTKPGALIANDAEIQYTPPHPWVSRAGVKLDYALSVFGVDPAGQACLDIGASTGGFTQVLLARGASRVFAVDVGRGQLHETLRADARVCNWEGQDARDLKPGAFSAPPSLVVCDASFIGLAKVLAPALRVAAPNSDVIALIKPQFETGPRDKEAVPDPEARTLADQVAQSLDGLSGFRRAGLTESPLRGGAGALEFLVRLTW
jgi:23S rRNA (cytidine1920-2'-O)/16S rRNA (cytidine1409-2'-O)-methyltransferase